ncbi:hypothetical protein PCASD_15549 [Puccinia coronata f. sp. avenae]|uniref:Uncharacterized protein n=1 Tax=Puccinia coronata f. sp. avenae TaxID=200324 RepID=A0A2N5TYC8_9BASI|nr:hypothetical protein PCASD_23979 [Puccinia coronata f. sp. avenae]PLW33299.1 hypothetical protein PCASD_15549 [Puccinia coronata f. sp. avenae]
MDYSARTFIFLLLTVLLAEVRVATPPRSNHQRANTPSGTGPHPIIFKSPLARQFLVPQLLPQVNFRIQNSYAGRLNVTEDPLHPSQMFFWLVPSDDARGSKDLTIWVNGDACSGLAGAFNGNGPITIHPGTAQPIKNPYSWTRSSNMLYLDIPLNAGFSRGRAPQRSSQDIAVFVFNFLKAFLKVFPEMNGLNLYMAGHAYSGTYISYVADKIYAQQSQLSLKLQGILLVNAFISTPEYQQHIPVASYVTKNNAAFKFSPIRLKKLQVTDEACGLSGYLNVHLTYPPKGRFLAVTKAGDPKNPSEFRDQCLIFYDMFEGASRSMNLWNIHDKPGNADPNFTRFVYPARADVRRAFNVAGSPPWETCADLNRIFPNGDSSPPPSGRVLPNVIQRSKRTVIAHGALDATLPVDGVALAIQSMTWGGKQGFQQPINSPFLVGNVPRGKYHTERGLTFVELTHSGSLIPHDQPQSGLSLLDYLLGHRPNP